MAVDYTYNMWLCHSFLFILAALSGFKPSSSLTCCNCLCHQCLCLQSLSMVLILPQLKAAATACWVKSQLLHTIIILFYSLAPTLLARLRTTPSCILCYRISYQDAISDDFKHTIYICASFPLHMLFLCLECSHHHPHFLQPLSDSWSFFRPQLKWCLLSETSPAPAFLIWMTCSLFYDLHISVTVHATVCFILVIVSCEVDRNKVDSSTFMSNMTLHCPSCSGNICWVDGVLKHRDI